MLIKLSLPGQPRPLNLSQFTGTHNGELANCKFRANDNIEEADAWFLFDGVDPEDNFCVVPPGQVHFLTAETSYRDDRWSDNTVLAFLQQFDHIHSCHPIDLPNARFSPPFLPWMVNSNHQSIFAPHSRDIDFFSRLENIEKDRPLSVFSSKKRITPSHQLRRSFAEKVSHHFKGDVDWFGNGINPIPEKWDGLARYERTVVLENRSDIGIYTEKILDPFLSLTLPIYWGAPDISSFLPVSPRFQINIRDISGSIKRIEGLLKTPVRQVDLERLLAGKERVLGELHFLRRIASIAESTASSSAMESHSPRPVTLMPENSFEDPEAKNLSASTHSFARALKRLIDRS